MQEQDIPIDIHSGKLLDWMLSRKVCGRDWQANVLAIREKINNAIQDMPVHKGITRLVSGSYINYFHCQKILAILRETEAGSKNLFGSYGSQRMKDWQEVVRLYERDKTYLAEAAQMLARNVSYEVPSLKKEIQHCEALLVEIDKKEDARQKSLHAAKAEFEAQRKSLGIPGKDFRRELLDRVNELPAIYDQVAESAASLKDPVELYSLFVTFVVGTERPAGCVPLLKHVIEKGNTSVYEWTNGKPPPSRASTETAAPQLTTEEEDNDEINFDEINFDDLDISVVTEGGGGGIDFEIAVEGSGSDRVAHVSCSDEQYATLLDTGKTKDLFVDELREVESFLRVRLLEMRDATDVLTLTQMQDAPTALQVQTQDSVGRMLASVRLVLDKVTDPVVHHLHNVKHSPRYVDNLANTLKQKLNMVSKMDAMQKELLTKQADTLKHIGNAQPKLKLIIEKTRELQGQIEQEISKIYKNRPVNIMGGVNAL